MNRTLTGKKRLIAVVLAVALLLSAAPSAVAETFSAIVTSTGMKVYKDAALSVKLGTLPTSTVVRVTSYSGRAARIKYGGKTGYASVSDMKAVDDVAVKAVTAGTAKVYQSASAKSKSVAVKAGTRLYVLAVSGSWAQVEKDGVVGYMSVDSLVKADDSWQTPVPAATGTPAPEPESVPEMTVRTFEAQASQSVAVYKAASASSKKLGTLKKGQVVTVGAYSSDGWACIRLNGKTGYCQYASLTPVESAEATAAPTPAPTPAPAAEAVSGTVTSAKLPVYKTASTKSGKLGTLKKGQTVNVLSWTGSWAYIELNGRYGYCAVSGLAKTSALAQATPSPTPTIAPTPTPSTENAAKGTVTVSSLAVYRTASTAADKLGTLKKGQVVNVLKWNDAWAYIELDGRYGFCAVKGLSRADAAQTAAPTPTPSVKDAVKATVTDASVTVYRLAGDTSTALGTLKKGREVNVLSLSGDWAYIELNGNYGFCKVSALTRTSDLNKTPEVPSNYARGGFTATVVYPGARAYASPASSASSTGLALGATVNVYAYSSEWACVTNGSGYAFVPVKQLSRTSYGTIRSDGGDLQTLLKALLSYGYYDGVPSTSYNSAAVAAIKRFQSACGLEETGEADQTLQRILYAGYAPSSSILSSSMSSGASGSNVTRLQTRLYALGYLGKTSSVDGDYGATTASAVTLFQTANGITATGTAYVETLKALYSTGAVSRPSGVKAADDAASAASTVSVSGTVKLSSTYVTTMPSALKSTASSYSSGMSGAQKLEHAIYAAQEKLGKPYVYGATGPNSFDCSGLTVYSFKQIGVSLKRSAYSQGYDSSYDKISSVGSLKRGDLVFFNTISDSDLSDHVGIYLGGGCFIHASSGGHKVVVSNLTSGYYNRVFSWGRRILK